MIQTVEAIIDEHGIVRLREGITLSTPRRALVIILDEEPAPQKTSTVIDWPIVMPQLGDSMKEAKINTWLKTDGTMVLEGDALAEIETDKALVEMEAQVSGILHIVVPAGQTVTVGQTIAIIQRGPARG